MIHDARQGETICLIANQSDRCTELMLDNLKKTWRLEVPKCVTNYHQKYLNKYKIPEKDF